MKNFIKPFFAIIIAVVIYSVFFKFSIILPQIINVFSLVVIYFALIKGEVFGACLGAFCGLVQDSFSLGVFGVAGIAKTITGFLAGYISKRIDVGPFVRNFLFIFILICLELTLWSFLYFFIFSERINTKNGLIFLQPLVTGLLGSTLFHLIQIIQKKEKY